MAASLKSEIESWKQIAQRPLSWDDFVVELIRMGMELDQKLTLAEATNHNNTKETDETCSGDNPAGQTVGAD